MALKPKTQRRMQRLQSCLRKSDRKMQSAYTKRWARGDFDSKKARYERRLAARETYWYEPEFKPAPSAPVTIEAPRPQLADALDPDRFMSLYPVIPIAIEIEIDYFSGRFRVISGYVVDTILYGIDEFVRVEHAVREAERLKRRGHVFRVESLEAIV